MDKKFPPCVYAGLAELDEFLNGKGPVYLGPDKNLQGSTLRFFERLSVQVWDLKKAGPRLAHLAVQKFVRFRWSGVNVR